MIPATPVAQLIGRIPAVTGSIEAFIDSCRQASDPVRHRAGFLRMMLNLHGIFVVFIKDLPEEEAFLDLCGDIYDSWRRGK